MEMHPAMHQHVQGCLVLVHAAAVQVNLSMLVQPCTAASMANALHRVCLCQDGLVSLLHQKKCEQDAINLGLCLPVPHLCQGRQHRCGQGELQICAAVPTHCLLDLACRCSDMMALTRCRH